MRDGKVASLRNVKEISAVLFRTEKRGLPPEVVYNFRLDFSQKFPFHFTFNQNFQIILLNGKHPNFAENLFKNCKLPTKVVLFFCSDRNTGKFLNIC